MEIFRIAGIGVITAIAVIILRESKPTMALVTALAGGLLILLSVIDMLTGIFDAINALIAKTGIDAGLIGIVLKIIGVGYITEFAAGVCEDAGTKSTGDKITLAGKIIIMALALPILTAIIELVGQLL